MIDGILYLLRKFFEIFIGLPALGIYQLFKSSSVVEVIAILLLTCVVVLLYKIYKRLYLILEDTAETRSIARQYKKREF